MWWLTTAALAYTLRTDDNGDPVRWTQFPVAWDHAADAAPLPDDGEVSLRAAFETWQSLAGADIAFDQLPGRTAEPTADADYENHVWMLDRWPFEGNDALAMASVWTNQVGQIETFDIQINGTEPWSTDGVPFAWDLQAAITHEVGHVLGIEHTDVSDACMYPTTSMGAVERRELHDDDISAAIELYAADPDQGLSCSSTSGGPPSWWFATLALPWLRRRGGPRPMTVHPSSPWRTPCGPC